MKKKVVLLQGAFDILHAAHIKAFKFAKAQGDYLIIALNTDRLISRYKSKKCIVPWAQRKIMIEACRYVDKVVPATEFSPLKLLKQHKVDVYVLSREWKHTKDVEFAYMKSIGGEVRFAARSRTISSSTIKERLLKEYMNGSQGKIIQPSPKSGTGVFLGGNIIESAVALVEATGTATGAVREGEIGEAFAGLPEGRGPASRSSH